MREADASRQVVPADGRPRPWLWFWLAVAAASLGLLVPKWVADVRWARAVEQWNNTAGPRSAIGQRNMDAVYDGLRTMQSQAARAGAPATSQPVSRADVEAKFGATGTITWKAPAPDIWFGYLDHASGWQGEFRLQNGGSSSAQWGGPGSAPTRPAWLEAIDPLRRRAVNALVLAWVALLVAAFVRGGHRPAVRHLLLAAAVLATVGWLLAPNYAVTLRGVMVNDAAGIGLAMIVVSAAVIAVPALRAAKRRRQMQGPPRCVHCGYDLSFNESGVCPECGTRHSFPTATAAAAPAGVADAAPDS